MQRKLLLIILPDVSLSSSLVQRAHFLTIYVNIYIYFITKFEDQRSKSTIVYLAIPPIVHAT